MRIVRWSIGILGVTRFRTSIYGQGGSSFYGGKDVGNKIDIV